MTAELSLRMPELIADDFPELDLPRWGFRLMGQSERTAFFVDDWLMLWIDEPLRVGRRPELRCFP